MNILSLFDGMSCGQIALERAKVPVDNYYASEIDKYAIKITQKNYPNTTQLGDVRGIDLEKLPQIDILLGGSPCQGFSFAGKQLNFQDPRSALFFEYIRILKEIKPKYFLLENVRMKKEYQDVISKALGVEPIAINSNLVSAQNRYRLYWTNIPNVTQPSDRGLLLKDIIDRDFVDRDKSHCLDANYFKGGNPKSYFEKHRRQLVFPPLSTTHSLTERRSEEAKQIRKEHREATGKDFSPRRGKVLVPRTDGKGNCLTATQTVEHLVNEGLLRYRKLTPLECERLQTVTEGYTEGISNTQRYKMLGNGWTVDVIAHILKGVQRSFL